MICSHVTFTPLYQKQTRICSWWCIKGHIWVLHQLSVTDPVSTTTFSFSVKLICSSIKVKIKVKKPRYYLNHFKVKKPDTISIHTKQCQCWWIPMKWNYSKLRRNQIIQIPPTICNVRNQDSIFNISIWENNFPLFKTKIRPKKPSSFLQIVYLWLLWLYNICYVLHHPYSPLLQHEREIRQPWYPTCAPSATVGWTTALLTPAVFLSKTSCS